MKKAYWIASVLLLTSCLAFGRIADNTELKDTNNIYYKAFHAYCSRSPSAAPETLLVEKDSITAKRIPRRIGVFRIEILSEFEIRKRLKKENALTIIKMSPLSKERGRFFIYIIPFRVESTPTGLNYINSGGTAVEFSYNGARKEYHVLSIKTEGI